MSFFSNPHNDADARRPTDKIEFYEVAVTNWAKLPGKSLVYN
ncbi:hypothetical protein [Acetomicrobium sp. UBA5826]|nr:hypothetical protein [Acetomicrobium sp. UBA5826]